MSRYARKVDANQAQIVAELRRVGAKVLILSAVGGGCPDLAVWHFGRWTFMECKNKDGRGVRYTPDQLKWREEFKGASVAVCDAREALEAIGAGWR